MLTHPHVKTWGQYIPMIPPPPHNPVIYATGGNYLITNLNAKK